ncbi:MAG: hypothetical protein ACT4QE_06525 [Anaerolineales bacterium]
MKARFVWMMLGLAFVVTLAIVIGQRLSAEAMAVMIGVVAGVAASIPTSLIVVWFATRTLNIASSRPPEPLPPAEPRIVVMAPQTQPMPFPGAAGYGQANGYPPAALPLAGPRQFNVIGGVEYEMQQSQVEVVWPR